MPIPLSYIRDVLTVVTFIPPGRVLSYGDIAGIVGRGGPRGVGRVMASSGHIAAAIDDTCAQLWDGIPWWRVVRSDGRPPQGNEESAMKHYTQEKTAMTNSGRLDMTACALSPEEWAVIESENSLTFSDEA